MFKRFKNYFFLEYDFFLWVEVEVFVYVISMLMFRCNFNFFCNKKKKYRIFVIFKYILYIFGINIFFLFVWCVVDILDFEEVEIKLWNIFVYVFI